MIQTTKIYLVTNIDNNPNKVYIGKTKSSRKSAHRCTFGSQITYNYIDQIDSLDQKIWKPLESFWIEQFRVWGFEVVNLNNGGSGPSFHSKETKSTMSKIRKGKPKPKGFGERNSQDKTRNIKIGNSMRGRIQSEEEKQNRRIPKPKEFGDKISKALTGKSKSKEHINNMMKNRLGVIEATIKALSKPIIQKDLEGNFIKEWPSTKSAKEWLGKGDITGCLLGKQKTAGGFIWEFK